MNFIDFVQAVRAFSSLRALRPAPDRCSLGYGLPFISLELAAVAAEIFTLLLLKTGGTGLVGHGSPDRGLDVAVLVQLLYFVGLAVRGGRRGE